MHSVREPVGLTPEQEDYEAMQADLLPGPGPSEDELEAMHEAWLRQPVLDVPERVLVGRAGLDAYRSAVMETIGFMEVVAIGLPAEEQRLMRWKLDEMLAAHRRFTGKDGGS